MASSSSSKDKHNFQCVTEASLELIKLPLKDILRSQIKSEDLFLKIKSSRLLLSGRSKLRPDQLKLCYFPPPLLPDYSKFDVTLLYTLIRNLCPGLKPTRGWGNDPDPKDTDIGDDIERLRLFRNRNLAHANSATIPDDTFDDLWRTLKDVLSRLKSHLRCRVDYEQELIEIKGSKYKNEIWDDYRNLCKLYLEIEEEANERAEPRICIKGEEQIICGDTAEFKAEVKRAEKFSFPIKWQRRRGQFVEIIDTTLEKYSGSTDTRLIIPSVCKEDALVYQASLSDGNNHTLYSNAINLHVLGEKPMLNDLEVTTEDKGIIIHYSFEVSKNSPPVFEITWSRNEQQLDMECDKFAGGSLHESCLFLKPPYNDGEGKYSCIVTNAVGSVKKDVMLYAPLVKISNPPKVEFASETIITSIVQSVPSPEKVQWQISNDGNKFHEIDITQPKYYGSNLNPETPRLVIKRTTFDDKLFYRLYVSNALGDNYSNTVDLKITGGIPNITVSHETDLSKKSIRLIGCVSLSDCSPNILEVFWTKNGERIDSHNSGGRISNVSIEDHSLTIKDVSRKDAGKYQLTAVNAVGKNISEIIDLDAPDVNLFSERSGKEGTLSFTATIKSNTPCNAQWYAKSKDGDTFTPIDVNDKEYRGTTNSLPHPMLVVKQMHHPENAIYQIKVTNFVDSTTKEIAGGQQFHVQSKNEMKSTKPSRQTTSHFFTLKEIFDFITDALKLCSDQSLTHILLNVIHHDEFLSELENLAKGVENFKKIYKDEYTGRPGEIYVFDVKVRYKNNQLHVVQEDPENWEKFLLAKEEEGIKIIRIQSRSIGVIEAKLHVYREFKNVIETKNILLHHALEKHTVLSNLSAHKKITSFCNDIDALKMSISSCNIPEIVTKSSKLVFTQERLLRVCNKVVLENIESEKSLIQMLESEKATKKLKDCLEGKIIFEIKENLCSILFDQLFDIIQSQIESSKRDSNFDIFNESRSKNICFLVDNVLTQQCSSMSSASDMAYASPHSLDEFTFDVNPNQWREKIRNELFHRIRKQEKLILSSVEVKILELCEITSAELKAVYGGLRRYQCGIKLVDQKNLVKTWQKREIKCEGKELSNFPSVINYIAGTKYGKPFVKVFCKYEDKEEERSIRMHSRPLQGTEYEFVNVPEKAGETEELEKIREKERDAPVLPDAIRIQLNKIINSKADAMYANFSTLTGLSVSTVRYKQGSFINDPCIVLYCLDKNLVPYGETQLPTIVGGYPCDKREGTFTLGSCADCRHNNPGPGCSIGMPSDSHTGSAGFLVKTTNSPYKTGFLTAAHVAIKDLLDLYDEGMFLSECVSMGNKNKEMVHPSYSQIDRNNYVGTVEESFIGDFGPYQEKISIDVAYVQSYTERLGETNKMEIAQDKFLKLDGTTLVTKKGQATGETNGKLVYTNFSFRCTFNRFPKCSFVFKSCYEIQDLNGESFFKLGDSGSGVFVTENNGKSKPLGIAFAHKDHGDITLVCRLSPIIEKCNLVIYEEEEKMEEE